MSKPLIFLSNTTTLVDDFNSYLDGSNVPFVVLGNTKNHKTLAEQAAKLALNWEIALYVPEPAGLYATLLAMRADDDCNLALTYDAPNLFAVAISRDKTVCYVMTTFDTASIAMAYMSAETH
jgi:hypothetical protein